MPAIDLDEEIDFDGEDDFINPPPVKQSKAKNIGTETVITKRNLVEASEDDEAVETPRSPLFDFSGGPAASTITRIRVVRKEPDNGVLGYIDDLSADETTIFERYGGGTYLIHGVDGRNKIRKASTIKIAGDPLFTTEADEKAWRKSKGLDKPKALPSSPLDVQEMLSLVDAREEKRRQEERDLEERRRREDREYQDRLRQQEKEWNAEQATRRKEDDERRRRDDDERDRRRREDDAKAQQQQQMFMTQMITMVQSQAQQSIAFVKETVQASINNQPKGDSSDLLLKGVQLALQLKEAVGGGDGEKDILQTVVENLPAMLNGIGNAASKVAREIKGNPGNQSNPPQALSAQPGQPGGLALPPGPLSDKLGTLVQRIAASGNDPEVVLSGVVDNMLKATEPKPARPVVSDKTQPIPANEVVKENPVVAGNAVVSAEDVAAASAKPKVTVEPSASKNGMRIKLGRE